MVTGELEADEAAERRARLVGAARHWILFGLESAIFDRCLEPFPEEPIRTLDAIHLATASLIRGLLPELTLLALDRRIRVSGGKLGFDLLPVVGDDLRP